jgi:hypothetical protein
MDRLLVLYYMRPGYVHAVARSIAGAAQSAGAAVYIGPTHRGRVLNVASATRRAPESSKPPLFAPSTRRGGLEVVVVYSPIRLRGGLPMVTTQQRSGRFRGMLAIQNMQRLRGSARPPTTQVGIRSEQQPPSNAPIPRPGGAVDVLESTSRVQARELLSAALANCYACQNWLLSPTATLDRAQLSIAMVIRDVNALEKLLR